MKYIAYKRYKQIAMCFRQLNLCYGTELEREYSHWLNTYMNFILFNYDFFNVDADELKKLASRLKIKTN